MNKIDFERAKSIIENFDKKRIVILGDIMLDQYIIGKVSRISPEAPVPVVEITSENYCLGGAGNVAHNLEALGAEYLLVGVIGDDNSGKKILEKVKDRRGIFIDEKRPTIVKTRIIAHHQHVEDLLGFTTKNNIPVFVDPKVEHFNFYSPITLITPNQFEVEGILNRKIYNNEEIESAGREILSKISCEYLIITRGEKGMSVFIKDNRVVHIPTVAKEVYDVTGAGDTVIATASLSLLSGADILESAILANYAAGIVVGKLGTATVNRMELLREIEKESKILL